MAPTLLDLDIRQTEDGRKILHFPFMSMSDIHWGTKGSRAKRVARWLEHTSADRIQLPGDIIGGTEQVDKPTWHFGGPWHRQGMAHMLRKAEAGTQVVYNPGNHDYHANRLNGKTLLGIEIEKETVYIDPKGRVGLIEHGDRYDENISKSKERRAILYNIGDHLLTKAENFDAWVVSKVPPLAEHFCSAAVFKAAVKLPLNTFSGVAQAVTRELESSRYQFNILGHSHYGGFKQTPKGKLEMNDGSCTQHVQALVHDAKGDWALLTIDKKGMTVEMEHPNVKLGLFAWGRQQYYVSWDSIGMADQMQGEPTLHDDIHTDNADRLLRLVCRAFPTEDRVALKESIHAHEREIAEFKRSVGAGQFHARAEFNGHRDKQQKLEELRASYLKLPVADPRRPAPEDKPERGVAEPVERALRYA